MTAQPPRLRQGGDIVSLLSVLVFLFVQILPGFTMNILVGIEMMLMRSLGIFDLLTSRLGLQALDFLLAGRGCLVGIVALGASHWKECE